MVAAGATRPRATGARCVPEKGTTMKMTVDVVLTATIEVDTTDPSYPLSDLRGELRPFDTSILVPLNSGQARITQLSLGREPRQPEQVVVSIGDDYAGITVDQMREPRVCAHYLETDDLGGIECEIVFEGFNNSRSECDACHDREPDDEDDEGGCEGHYDDDRALLLGRPYECDGGCR